MKLNVLALTILIVFNSDGQSLKFEDIPPSVQATFFYEVSNSRKVKWEMVDEVYLASLKEHGKALELLINKRGILLMIEREIVASELPRQVSEKLAEDYKGTHVKRVSKINRQGVFTYFVVAKKKNWLYELTFSSFGKIIKHTEKFADK